ncbi:MAG: hypothetical protein H7A53_00880 [Akkermansiaceae bacterium]|nr:hypothetical protein [Akkermansiaceae bacterium]
MTIGNAGALFPAGERPVREKFGFEGQIEALEFCYAEADRSLTRGLNRDDYCCTPP